MVAYGIPVYPLPYKVHLGVEVWSTATNTGARDKRLHMQKEHCAVIIRHSSQQHSHRIERTIN